MVAPRSIPPTRTSSRPPEQEAEERGSRVMRFGAAVSAVVLASAVGTLPAAVRVAPSVSASCGIVAVWVALTAAVLLPMALATIVVRHAHAALRLFDPAALSTGLAVAGVWALASFVALVALGAFLRATTHHHGLAGVTFASTGLAVSALVAVFATRVVAWGRATSPWLRWTALALGGILLGTELASVWRALARSEQASIWCADILALVLAATFGALAFPERRRPFVPIAVAGPPLAAVVLVLGFATLGGTSALRTELADDAPVISSALALVSSTPAPVQPPAPRH